MCLWISGNCNRRSVAMTVTAVSFSLSMLSAHANEKLPIADAHVHYSHDSVEQTPPERVIELMRSANLKFALVSSSDDNGTQLLSDLAPDLIIPGLRPYRRRGELSTWFNDQGALDYVEDLLAKNTYASIGEFHLYGDSADLPIPRRIVELADEYNLVLHAHSDADAVERLLAQNENVKVLWAHSGFDDPADIATMLDSHDRLWADLAFRSEVGSGGSLSDEWRALFEAHPDRLMLGTDTYTPERMYYIPNHAESARIWLDSLSHELAEKVAWRNAHDLLMPIWEANKGAQAMASSNVANDCTVVDSKNEVLLEGDDFRAIITSESKLTVSESLTLIVKVCGDVSTIENLALDASMPMHGHGTNYTPTVTLIETIESSSTYRVEGLVLHMPGHWQWDMEIKSETGTESLTTKFMLQ